jgi:hypothetical protein
VVVPLVRSLALNEGRNHPYVREAQDNIESHESDGEQAEVVRGQKPSQNRDTDKIDTFDADMLYCPPNERGASATTEGAVHPSFSIS